MNDKGRDYQQTFKRDWIWQLRHSDFSTSKKVMTLGDDGWPPTVWALAIDGLVEVNGQTYRIRSKEDIEKVLKLL